MNNLYDILKQRVMVLDGAMGTMIQRYTLSENDFRGEEFAEHPYKVVGNNDMLVLTRPDIISAIHREYLEAGADIIETCTFNSQAISQSEYGLEHYVSRLNISAARLAREQADRMSAITPSKPRFVAGSVGPTGKTLSMSPDVDSPSFRAIDFDTLQSAYIEQIEALVEGGVDLLLIETVFDTLNAKAALTAAELVFEKVGRELPIILSITVADAAGRTLSGQTLEAVVASVAHFKLLAIGLNCSFGAAQMEPFLRDLAAVAPCYISAYPNAGLPDAMGRYSQTAQMMASDVARFAEQGIVNIVGGCCGSTPDHIRAIADVVAGATPHIPFKGKVAWLAGLEPLDQNGAFVNVGERCNVAGSRKFLRLIKERSYNEALSIARKQVEDGAMILDINMDDAMIDAKTQMVEFLNLMASDPDVARVPWMIDSSDFEVIKAALKTIQGKAVVNSLSLKEGEEVFVARAQVIKSFGAAVVVMAFDEQGQATTFERKIEICSRAYRLLTERVGFAARDIIFDPNILTIATGIAEHDKYALDFIRATKWIAENLKGTHISGGVSNLSFAFRGNNYLREAMHAVFLYHASAAGMDMAIVNPSTAVMYEDIDPTLRTALEDVILARRVDAAERLLAVASTMSQQLEESEKSVNRGEISLEQRLVLALQRGDDSYLEQDLTEALACYSTAAEIIEKPLMQGMTYVGELFGEGKMFLPQVVKSARTMKRAVAFLQPYLTSSKDVVSAGKYLVATVKGDVHDIGKNIAAVILACNGFEVIDLGVMVSAERIVEAAKEHNVDYIGLSGLITPSLEQMALTAERLAQAGIDVPLFISGATTSAIHTAVKIAPLYNGPVFHIKDASQNPILAHQLSGSNRATLLASLASEQSRLRQEYSLQQQTTSAELPRINVDWDTEQIVPQPISTFTPQLTVKHVSEYINWIPFFHLWRTSADSEQGAALKREAEQLIAQYADCCMRVSVGFYEAYSEDTCIVVNDIVKIPTPRQRKVGADGVAYSLSDFVAPKGYGDSIGAFAITIPQQMLSQIECLKESGDDYGALLLQSLADRLAEAASEYLHKLVREFWIGEKDEDLSLSELFAGKYRGIRPAVGYPSLPEQSTIFEIDKLLNLQQIGITLTQQGAMYPQSSVCGIYLASKRAKYFIIA